MDVPNITPEGITAQKMALLRQEVGSRVLRMSIDAEASHALQLIQMMNASTGIGTQVDTQA